jgi:hypothetical protein
MKKNKYLTGIILMMSCAALVQADFATINQVGVGARAFSFANNYVALSNDLSGVFWNPGALSLLPVREFQVSTDFSRKSDITDFNGTKSESYLQRMRIDNAGFLLALPTSRGGLTFAAAYQSPYIFDDNPSFKGIYKDSSYNSYSRDYGNLNFWSGAFGLQVAPGLGVGAAFSVVTGTEKTRRLFSMLYNGVVPDTFNDNYEDNVTRDYVGYDLRFGLLYSLNKVRFGARLVLPQTIWFSESYTETYPSAPLWEYDTTRQGQLFSPINGALGVSAALPFGTVSSELRFRAPYDAMNPEDSIPSYSAAHHSSVGAGLGVEIPLGNSNTLFRGGYSWDQYDTHLFALQYDNENPGWSTEGLTVARDRQLITAGLAYVAKSWSLEGSYGYQFWKLDTKSLLIENNKLQRVLVSFSVRF